MEFADGMTLHSRFNRITAILLWAAAAFMIVSGIAGDDSMVWVYPGAALLAYCAWAALWRPFVRVDDQGVTLANVTHHVDVPWAALIDVETRHALTLVTPEARFAAWSAPAPSALMAALAGRKPSNREARLTAGDLRPGDLLGTESGDAATIIREEWRARTERGRIEIGVADEMQVARSWDVVTITAIVLLVLATAFTLALTS